MRVVFGSIAAQADNLGDIAIRSVVVHSFVDAGWSATIYVGGMPQSYIEAFGFSSQVKLVSNRWHYQWLLSKAVFLRRADFLFAPGPAVLRDSPKAILKSAGLLGVSYAICLTGGRVYSLGRAIRGTGKVARWLEVRRKNLSKAYSVRDDSSAAFLQAPCAFVPDLAFARPVISDIANARPYVSISFRSDRPVHPEMLGNFVRQVREHRLEPLFVTQVQRDDEHHKNLAEYFGAEAVLWEHNTHAEQMSRVVDAYEKSHALLSNRLHGIIFGVSQGAFPVEWSDGKISKIRTTLESVLPYLEGVKSDAAEASGYRFLTLSERERHLLLESYCRAGNRVREFFDQSF
ncbi:polysaccharide pyruvyl transferase family protein [Pseudarthrobacter siccitolerans]